MSYCWNNVRPIVDIKNIQKLCINPYSNHPKGCPNFNKKEGCPPKCLTIDKLIDLNKPVWAIWNIFDFEKHCNKMKLKHPNWSKRQVECCLYWQPKARKELKHIIHKFLVGHPHKLVIVKNPEGAGVNLTATMESIGIKLEWPPITKTYQIALAGYRKEN